MKTYEELCQPLTRMKSELNKVLKIKKNQCNLYYKQQIEKKGLDPNWYNLMCKRLNFLFTDASYETLHLPELYLDYKLGIIAANQPKIECLKIIKKHIPLSEVKDRLQPSALDLIHIAEKLGYNINLR